MDAPVTGPPNRASRPTVPPIAMAAMASASARLRRFGLIAEVTLDGRVAVVHEYASACGTPRGFDSPSRPRPSEGVRGGWCSRRQAGEQKPASARRALEEAATDGTEAVVSQIVR